MKNSHRIFFNFFLFKYIQISTTQKKLEKNRTGFMGNNTFTRIDLLSEEHTLTCRMKGRQFHIIPAFAIKINKGQGQSYNILGLYLPTFVFSHGQLYVALSRAK